MTRTLRPARRVALTYKLYRRMIANPDERIPFTLTEKGQLVAGRASA